MRRLEKLAGGTHLVVGNKIFLIIRIQIDGSRQGKGPLSSWVFVRHAYCVILHYYYGGKGCGFIKSIHTCTDGTTQGQ